MGHLELDRISVRKYTPIELNCLLKNANGGALTFGSAIVNEGDRPSFDDI